MWDRLSLPAQVNASKQQMLPFRSIRPAVIYLTKQSQCLEFIFNIFLLLLIFLAQVLRVMVMRDSVKKRGAKPWELLSDPVFINLPSESFHTALHYRDKDIMVFTAQTVYSDTECVFCYLYTHNSLTQLSTGLSVHTSFPQIKSVLQIGRGDKAGQRCLQIRYFFLSNSYML